MNTEQDEVELETSDIEHHMLMGEALERLEKNPDFQLVVVNGYLKEKALASVSLLAVPQVIAEGRRPGIIEDLISSSNLGVFFLTVKNFHEGCKNPVLSDEEEAEIELLNNPDGE